jgi:site-specific recombinase XerD
MLSEIKEFVNWVHRRNPQARTWRDYSYDLQLFAKVTGDIPLAAVTIRHVDTFVQQQTDKGRKATTRNRRLAAIQALYTYWMDEDTSLECPVLPHRHHAREPQPLPRPVQEEGLRQFFAVISDPRDRAMFILMLRCGLRISEVANIRICDIYLNDAHPHIIVRGKGSRERTVYLSSQTKGALRAYLVARPKTTSEFVFLSYQLNGMSTTAIHKRLMHYRQASGVDITCHRLRHTFANDLLSVDVPVTSIQALLGHRWLETTQVYVKANDKKVQDDYYAACLKLDGWMVAPDWLQAGGVA